MESFKANFKCTEKGTTKTHHAIRMDGMMCRGTGHSRAPVPCVSLVDWRTENAIRMVGQSDYNAEEEVNELKFSKRAAVSIMVLASLTMQYTVMIHPIDAVLPSEAAMNGTGLAKLDEILLMMPLWRDVSFRFTVDIQPHAGVSKTPSP